jgi:small subunit ribosomal protein S25e
LGGAKKKTLAQAEKQQDGEQAKTSKEEKRGGKGRSSQIQASIKNMTVPKIEGSEVAKIFRPMKAVTIYSTSKALGINASLAWGLIKNLEAKGNLRREGGYSGHYVYRYIDTEKTQE